MVTLEQIKELRGQTQCPMMECKQALQESDGDFEQAKTIMRQKLGAIGDTKTSTGQEGFIIIEQFFQGIIADEVLVMLQISTDTDFVAKNKLVLDSAKSIASAISCNGKTSHILDNIRAQTGENIQIARKLVYPINPLVPFGTYVHFDNKTASVVSFKNHVDEELRKQVAMHVVAASPQPRYISSSDVPESELTQERILLEGKAKDKPDNIKEKIVDGGLSKFKRTISLLEQPFIIDNKQTVQEAIGDAGIISFDRWAIGE